MALALNIALGLLVVILGGALVWALLRIYSLEFLAAVSERIIEMQAVGTPYREVDAELARMNEIKSVWKRLLVAVSLVHDVIEENPDNESEGT